MRQTCSSCGMVYDDAVRTTVCPHPELIGPYAKPETELAKKRQAILVGFLDFARGFPLETIALQRRAAGPVCARLGIYNVFFDHGLESLISNEEALGGLKRSRDMKHFRHPFRKV